MVFSLCEYSHYNILQNEAIYSVLKGICLCNYFVHNSWLNPWAFFPLLLSAVGIILTLEVVHCSAVDPVHCISPTLPPAHISPLIAPSDYPTTNAPQASLAPSAPPDPPFFLMLPLLLPLLFLLFIMLLLFQLCFWLHIPLLLHLLLLLFILLLLIILILLPMLHFLLSSTRCSLSP